MTVDDLIFELQKYPGNAIVLKESFLGTFYVGLPTPCTQLLKSVGVKKLYRYESGYPDQIKEVYKESETGQCAVVLL